MESANLSSTSDLQDVERRLGTATDWVPDHHGQRNVATAPTLQLRIQVTRLWYSNKELEKFMRVKGSFP